MLIDELLAFNTPISVAVISFGCQMHFLQSRDTEKENEKESSRKK